MALVSSFITATALTATQTSKQAAEMAIQAQHLARHNYHRHVFPPLSGLDPNTEPSPTSFLDTKVEGNEVLVPVTDRIKDSVVPQASSGNDTYTNFWDFDKAIASSRMERHYLQQHLQPFVQNPQSQESATSRSSTSSASTSSCQYSQDFGSRSSTPLTDCSSFDTYDSAPGWRLRKIKGTAEARSAPAPLQSFTHDPQFSTYSQKSPLPPRPARHWTNAMLQVGGTPCVGFQFGSLANETSLDLNFLWAGSLANEMKNSPLADFVSSDRFFKSELSGQAMLDGVQVSHGSSFGSRNIGEKKEVVEGESEQEYHESQVRCEPWAVGLWPLVLDKIQNDQLEYLAGSWWEHFMEQHIEHDELENSLDDLDMLGVSMILEYGA
ncbi:hypothetical protein BGZ82_002405 [Podila clonocystis]|nr:hypothetical protein BGZ82_002405 [Podila clonocystis]